MYHPNDDMDDDDVDFENANENMKRDDVFKRNMFYSVIT